MSPKFEYHDIPAAQIKADEANAAKAVEEMLAGADDNLRDEAAMAFPPEDGVSPTHTEAVVEAEHIAKQATADIDTPWYISNNKDYKYQTWQGEPLAGASRDQADSTKSNRHDDTEQNTDAPQANRVRKMLGRFFRAKSPEPLMNSMPAGSDEAATATNNEHALPQINLSAENIEDTADFAAAIGKDAAEAANKLTAENNLNYIGTEMLARAAAGLYNGNGIDRLTYNRLPEAASQASHAMAVACASYFVSVGLRDEITSELTTLAPPDIEDAGPADVRDADFDRYLINKMQLHLSVVGRQEDRRLHNEFYNGLARSNGHGGYETITPDPIRMRIEQLAGNPPYNEAGIKEVVQAFGKGLGPVVMGLHEVAPLDVSRAELLKGTAYYVKAAHDALAVYDEPEPPAGR